MTGCVLTLYEIADELLKKHSTSSFDEIYSKLVVGEKAAQKNCYRFNYSVDKLKELICQPSNCGDELIVDIAHEYEIGATYMFVQPVVGAPVYGMHIKTFLDQVKM